MAKRKVLHTKLCDMLGIEYPILLAGMGGLAGEGASSKPKLVGAVSNAGGMGVLGASGLPLDELRAEIREIKSYTDKPFGVDLLLPSAIKDAPPADMSLEELKRKFVPKEHIEFLEKLKAEYNVVTVADEEEMVFTEEHSKKQVTLMLDEKVPLFCSALGVPEWLVPMAHEGGMKVMGLAGNVKTALRHKNAGADFIIAQGSEAGGHTGRVSTLTVVPQIVDAVAPTPILAAGGIGDGRGLIAALALGAVGVWVGTAFLFAEESNIPELHRKIMTEASEEDTRVSRVWTGKTMRQIKNPIQEEFDNSGLRYLPMTIQMLLTRELISSLSAMERNDLLVAPAGQIVGMLDKIRPAKEILEEMVAEAVELFGEELPKKLTIEA